MIVIINGEAREIAENSNLAQLVEMLELAASRVAVELNQNVVRRAEWQKTAVRENDRIEIVHFVGGG